MKATDTLSNVGNPTVYAWAIDTTAPTVNITSSPPLLTATAGTPSSYSWTMDSTPPTVAIDAGPSGWVLSHDATFQFSSPDVTATFECHLDGLGFSACTSPTTYSSLASGQHTFYVRAIDAVGNISTSAQRAWTVDTQTHRPDGQIATGTTYAGDGIYNTTGTGQTKSLKAAVGQTVSFKIMVQNDGSDTDTYTVSGPGSGKGYTVTYFLGTTDITSKVTAGTYKVSLAPTTSKIFTLKVKVGSSAATSRAMRVKATSGHDPTQLDAVKAVVKRG